MGKLRCVNPALLSPFTGFSTMVSSMPQASVDSPREALPWLTGRNPSPIAAVCGPTDRHHLELVGPTALQASSQTF